MKFRHLPKPTMHEAQVIRRLLQLADDDTGRVVDLAQEGIDDVVFGRAIRALFVIKQEGWATVVFLDGDQDTGRGRYQVTTQEAGRALLSGGKEGEGAWNLRY